MINAKSKNYSTQRKGSAGKSRPAKRPAARSAAREKKPVDLLPKGKTREEKEQEKALSAQNSIPYLQMSPGGICQVDKTTWSKTIRFEDINYQLQKDDEKQHIFSAWCDFLNSFDSSVAIQISFINHHSDMREFKRMLDIPSKEDGHDELRKEYADMLKRQLAMGHNGVMKERYITFAVQAETLTDASMHLGQVEDEIMKNFKVLGVRAEPLDGKERLKILYEAFHPGETAPFTFDYRDLLHSGLSTKDYIAPSSFTFRDGRHYLIGDRPGAVSFLQIEASQITDKVLSKFLSVDADLILNMHIQSIENNKALKMVKEKMTDINKMVIEEQKKAVRSGYDMDILPADLQTYGTEAKNMLHALQTRNERMFRITILILNTEETMEQLRTVLKTMGSAALEENCLFKRLDYLQEEGVMSSIPLGKNFVPIHRDITTTTASIFIPFTTQELFMGGDSLYYGLNATSGNMIMADRKKLMAPNGLILGTPGSGKSFAAKREITNAYFATDDDIIICDPEGEYYPLVEALGGQVVRLYSGSKDYINPMDITMHYSGENENPLSMKSDFIMSLCDLIMHNRGMVNPIQHTMVDRAMELIYEEYLKDPRPEKMPTLADLCAALKLQNNEQADLVATSLELYVSGSMNYFNHRTNVELNNRVVCFDIKDLDNSLKKIGMFIVQDQIWNRVSINRTLHKSTRYYQDEFHVLLNQPQTAEYSVQIWKRFRKWGGIPTGITQNVSDLRNSPQVNSIFSNSDFIIMLNQRGEDQKMLAQTLGISDDQMKHVTWSQEGEGLLFFGNTILPFKDKLPKETKLYKLITTKPEDLREIKGGEDHRT